MSYSIAIRADGSAQIGAGHVSRCLALADGLARCGAAIRFISRELPAALRDLIVQHGHEVRQLQVAARAGEGSSTDWQEDVRLTKAELADRPGWDWIIVDHYELDSRWQSGVASLTRAVMVIDDLADRAHACDLLLDQNEYPQPAARYARWLDSRCRPLLGARYALLRPEFKQGRAVARLPRTQLQTLLVFFGGSDAPNLTAAVLQALAGTLAEQLAIEVVVGAMNPHRRQIEALCAGLPNARCHVQPADFSDLLLRADLAIGAAGTTSWERCCVGLPAVLFTMAVNQVEVAQGLARRRAGINLGNVSAESLRHLPAIIARLMRRPSLLRRLSQRAARLVDGSGVERVCLAMLKEGALQLRPARAGDAELAWTWRNAESTRRYSFDSAPIALERHQVWWQAALQSRERFLLIGEIGGVPVGVLRFDVAGVVGTISVYLDPLMTGQGLGPVLIRAGVRWARVNLVGADRIEAFVKPENVASRKAFVAAGFTEQQACFVRTLSADGLQ